jgi:3D (Asp-Asp-Asp) domain-containing protein
MIILFMLYSYVKRVITTKNPAASSLILGSMLGLILLGTAVPGATNADLASAQASTTNSFSVVKNGKLTVCKLDPTSYEVVKKVKMIVTAYSSTEDQTDDTPFITASGKTVADGIIANNMLAFGSKVRIPELYGDKIFVVEDRMHSRKGIYHADIWMPTYQKAKNFGAKITYIEVLES